MNELNEFIEYLYKQVGQPYVWGAQGTLLTPENYEKIIDRREEKTTNRKAAKKFCVRLFDKGEKELRAFDCSGLGMYYLQNLKHIFADDMPAHYMWKSCTTEKDAKRGYWVFHVNNGRARHIGYMVSDTEVVHAKGRSEGVVIETFKKARWNAIGKPKCFKFDESKPTSQKLVYVKGGSVNVRKGETKKFPIIGIAHRKDTYPLLAIAPSGWYMIQYGKQIGYISNRADLTEVR